MPFPVGVVNNTNINVNAGAGSIVNVEVINTNAFGQSLFPPGLMDMFGGQSAYSFPALLPSFLGAPRVDLMPFAGGPARTDASAGPAPAVKAPAEKPSGEHTQESDGCTSHRHKHEDSGCRQLPA